MSSLLWAAIKQDAPSSLVGLVQDMNPGSCNRDGGLLVPAEYNQGYFWAFENADAFRDVLKLRARIKSDPDHSRPTWYPCCSFVAPVPQTSGLIW